MTERHPNETAVRFGGKVKDCAPCARCGECLRCWCQCSNLGVEAK